MPAPRMAGSASSIENLAAASRARPRKIPPAIVEPAREMPGARAKAWKKPMTAASPNRTRLMSRASVPRLE